jgi:peptidyl-prolyl cis-trans isomerase SurA
MVKIMKKTVLLAGLLFALPLLAQNPPANPPPPDTPQAQKPPSLEAPQMAAPEAEKEQPKKPVAPPAKSAAKPALTGEGKVVEEIVARVNNEIITTSELQKARSAAAEDAQQECNGRCTPEQLQVAVEDRQKFALRDLIDQSLLAQRGKDMSINVEGEVGKQLDVIRIQNKLDSMEKLESAVTKEGLNWDDFKNNIRNKLLTQEVIRREVGSHINIGHDDAMKYYEEHKKEFVMPEQVALRAIEISTEGKTEAELPDLKKKAEGLLQRIKDGEDFATIATKQGFLVLQVLERYEEGEQPFEKVESKIMDQLYSERMEPALREYLKTLREQSYVVVKPGYQDMAGGGNSEIEEVSATPEASKEKKGHKKYLLFGKKTSG